MNYIANFDYELNLKNLANNKKISEYQKINRELEYLFFWSSTEGHLVTKQNYSEEYLDSIRAIFPDKKISYGEPRKGVETKNWWGQFNSEMIANSKCWQLNFFNECEVAHLGKCIVDKNQKFQFEDKALFREEYSFSGMGQKVFEGAYSPFVRGVVSKFVHVDHEFGVIVNRDQTVNISINSSEKNGRFTGAKYYIEFDRQKEEFEKIGDVNILFREISKFSNLFFKKFPNAKSTQVDGIISKGRIYFTEINHRRTLGTFCLSFAREFKQNYELIITKNAFNSKNILSLTPKENFYNFNVYLNELH